MAGKVIRAWRVVKADPSGMLCWFDPWTERVEIHSLPVSDPGVTPGAGEVDMGGLGSSLDRVVSVSASGDGDGDSVSSMDVNEELPF